MGVLSDLVIAELAEAQAVADCDEPCREWEGFSCKGLDHVKLCTLLSLLQSGSPQQDFERFLDLVDAVSAPTEEGALVFAVLPEQVAQLASVAAMGADEFRGVATAWGKTDELSDWHESEVADLLRKISDLADSAALQSKCLLLWIHL
jgi:hypothetical protein